MVACRYGISLQLFNSLLHSPYSWDTELNTHGEIPYLPAPMYYSPIAHLVNPRDAAAWQIRPNVETTISWSYRGDCHWLLGRKHSYNLVPKTGCPFPGLSNISPPGIPWATIFPLYPRVVVKKLVSRLRFLLSRPPFFVRDLKKI